MRYGFHVARKYLSHYPLSTLVISALIFFICGIGFTKFVLNNITFHTGASSRADALRLKDGAYPLVSPLLLCNLDANNLKEDKPLESIIETFVKNKIATGAAEDMSVYTINYKTGQWIGVNENDRYDPASLLKVPIMIAYFALADENLDILNQQVAYNGDDQNTDEYFKSPNDIRSGKYYTNEQLIESMIVNSDNTAAVLLQKEVAESTLQKVYSDLSLPVPPQGHEVEYLTVKSYGYFFRVLYNATYLSPQFSEKALELLDHSDFKKGIESGVPEGVTVAQKFGERTMYGTNNAVVDRELHDCGIVYNPGSPYLLCIMSRGKDFDTLAKNISDLSRLVYEKING